LAQGSNSCAANSSLQQKKYYAFSYVDTVCGLKVFTDKDYFQCICFVWHNEAQEVTGLIFIKRSCTNVWAGAGQPG